MDLFDYRQYPETAGYKVAGTSQEAAASVDAKTLQRLVLNELSKAPGTADEIAARLHIDRLSIRPRISELRAQNRVLDTGERRQNASGRSAAVFKLAA